MGHYLRDYTVDLILNAMDAYFAQSSVDNNQTHHVLSIVDPSYANYTFRFEMKNAREVKYARNLAKIYRLLVGDFKRAHNATLAAHLNQFSRFMYVSGSFTGHLCGKSIYDTSDTLAVNVHYPDKHNERNIYSSLQFLPREQGIDSHFRYQYNLAKPKSANATVSIHDLKIDLNYLFCYYRRALKSLLNLDIVVD